MANLKFTFDKPYDEVEINEENYKLYYDDESLKTYRAQATKYQKEVKEYLGMQRKADELSEEEFEQTEKQGMEFAKDFIETFCGKGSFEKLYGSSGKSMLNFMPLIEFIFEWLDSKIPDVKEAEEKKKYYTKKHKRQK